ncbi:hypothetical protein [Streptomyces sp. NPDC054786]
MSELIATCTPNSHPHDGEVLVAINLPNWESFRKVPPARRCLADAGFAPSPISTPPARPAGVPLASASS